MTGDEIREAFLRFFAGKGHTILPSSSLIPQGDPTLLLTTAGMVQIKPYFLGLATPPNPRLASCQKCFRTTDIDSVGDNKHLTFFEMLGNFSVGDYFKREAINWAWEFVTQWLKLPPERLWITIFLDDEEAFNYWREIGVPTERIVRLGEKDNFWGPAGDSGPCGPCSEIHWDFGVEFGCGKPDCGPGCDCARFSEIWNLVFTQYNQDKEGKRTPLPKPNIDTGMGLERTAAVMQGKISVYETDLFASIVAKVAELAGNQYGQDETVDRAIRIVAEHARGITFLIADGVLPSKEKRGYVLRRILRRASLFGWKLGIKQQFLERVAEEVIERMEHVYPEQLSGYGKSQPILNAIYQEERQFHYTLDVGLFHLDGLLVRAEKEGRKVIQGEDAFMLHDTYGFLKELTEEIAAERGFSVDLVGFEREMGRQREKARAAQRFGLIEKPAEGIYEQLGALETGFVGYEKLKHVTSVIGLMIDGKSVDEAIKGQEVEVILRETPFYGEMGGQVGDRGNIIESLRNCKIEVVDTFKPLTDLTVHSGRIIAGEIHRDDEVVAEVDAEQRHDIERNHTATHLLQAALRQVLGKHIRQSGSLVTPDRLRFDFTHPTAITKEEREQIEHLVTEKIYQNLEVDKMKTTYHDAVRGGALAFFEGKYGDEVRVVEILEKTEFGLTDIFSAELCGGTHVKSTGEIHLFRIVSEGSIGSGVRRIEAVTGREAEKFLEQRLSILEMLAQELQASPEEVQSKLSATLTELDKERKRALSLELELARKEAESLLGQVESIEGINFLSTRVSAQSLEAMREMGDRLKERLRSAVIVLGAIYDDKPYFVAMVTPDLVAKGFHAGEMVKQITKVAGGGGGGRAELGQGSGKDVTKLDEALKQIGRLITVHYDKDSGT